MERNWIYKDDLGSEYGPYSREELERYAREGRVSHQGTVKDPQGKWMSPEEAGLDLPEEMVSVESRTHPVTDSEEAKRESLAGREDSRHQRVVYMLVGILPPLFFSIAGVNNLIVGRTSIGISQLVLSIITILSFLLGAVLFIPFCLALPLWLGVVLWSIIESCTNNLDGEGRVMT